MNGNTVATDLRNAALVVEQGWAQDTMVDRVTGYVCADGALRLAAGAKLMRGGYSLFRVAPIDGHEGFGWGPEWAGSVRYVQASNWMEKSLGLRLVHWNDCYAGSSQEVADKMREAADKWEEEHMGQIGPVRRKVDLEPMPASEPVKEPSPQPVREPVPTR